MRALLFILLGGALCGCVSVKSDHGLVPPSGLCSDFRAPLVVPRGPVDFDGLKVGEGSKSVYLHEWVYTGLDVGVTDMTLAAAMAQAGITELVAADYEQYSILGFVTLFKVTAYGR